jgi:Cu/Ag efflux pump CusA
VFGDTTPELPPTATLLSVGTAADPLADPARQAVWVTGPELEQDTEIAARLVDIVRAVPGVALAHVRDDRIPELVLELRREQLARHNLQTSAVRDVLAAALGELRLGAIHDGDSRTPVVLAVGEPGGAPADLAARAQALTITGAAGPVRLGDLVDIRLAVTPAAIVHRERQRAVGVDLRFTRADPAAREAVRDAVARALELPPGHTIVWE